MAVHRSSRTSCLTRSTSTTSFSISASPREDGKTGEHLITVRVYDRYENVGVAKTVIPAARHSRRQCDLSSLLRRGT